MTRTVKRDTADIAAAMRKRYPSNAYALLFEVGDGTGMKCTRHVDAIAVSLWPSRGLDIYGFEFKASRSDWVKERDNPAKAEAIMRYCDYFYLCVTDAAMVLPGELPESWGMLELQGQGTLRGVKEAKKLSPVPLDRSFVAAMMRRAAEPVAAFDASELYRAEQRGRETEAKRSNVAIERFTKEIADLNKAIYSFENTTGISITDRFGGVRAQEVALAIKSLATDADKRLEMLREVARIADRTKADADAAIRGIEGLRHYQETKAEGAA